jgi:hypothetical protein
VLSVLCFLKSVLLGHCEVKWSAEVELGVGCKQGTIHVPTTVKPTS